MSGLYNGSSAYKLDEYEKYAHQNEKKQNQKALEHKVQNAALCRVLTVVIIAIFAVASVFVYSNVMMIRAASKVESLKKELALVTEQNNQKQIKIGQKLDMKHIEEKAINELGMQRPENSQIVYVEVKQASYSETLSNGTNKKDNVNLFESIFGVIAEYFGK